MQLIYSHLKFGPLKNNQDGDIRITAVTYLGFQSMFLMNNVHKSNYQYFLIFFFKTDWALMNNWPVAKN